MPLNPFENPVNNFQSLSKKFQWKCWGESCPVCEALEGRIYTMDQWLAGGMMPMSVHAHCDCTLKQVDIDTETSDPDLLGSDLNLLLADKKYNFLLDSSYRTMPFVMLDKLKLLSKPGGTALAGAKALKAELKRQNTDWIGAVWSLFPWGRLWKKTTPTKTRAYKPAQYHGLDGFGQAPSLYTRPEVLRAQLPTYTYHDKFNW